MNNLNARWGSRIIHSQPMVQYTLLHKRSLRLLAGLATLLLGSTLHAATLTRTSAFTYDANTGLLLTESIEPDNTALRLDTTYTYDAFGNKITATVSGIGITSRTTTTTYDAQGRFPISASNALGHTETRVFDPRFGTVTQVTGPNGLVSSFAFDTWGRPTTESGPDGVVTTTVRGLCPTSGCLTLAAYYVTVSKSGTPTATAYFDKFNRQLRTQTVGFNGTNVLKDSVYDALGRVASVSRPYYSGATIVYTTYSYDLLNRVTATTDPLGKMSYVSYNGLSTTSTNVLSQTTTSVKNSQGQLVSVTDALNKTISYTYDPFGNLLTTTDPAGNVTTLTYDLRGRKTGMNDPDMGESLTGWAWSYTYDVLGELITQTDAKGQVTTNTYDLLGRMTHRAEPDLVTDWYYDTATASNPNVIMAKGKLVTSITSNGQTRDFIYDTLGRLVNTDTRNGTWAPILVVSVSYDTLGRVATRTTPAGFLMQNTYNTNGYLSQVQSLVTSVFPVQMSWTATALSADGQLSGGTFGNGVTEARTIDNLGRTTAVNATHPTLGAATILGYTYDALGNLVTRVDTTQILIENYTFDALNRITGVTSSNSNQAAKSYFYDTLGNITSKSDTGTYTYAALRANGTNRPHAVSSIAGSWNTSFTYDANGNIISGGGRTYIYTSFNLPSSITRNNGNESILYGADHERAQLTEPDGSIMISLNPRLDSGTHYDQIAHPNGVTEDVDYFYADNRPIGIYSINANGANGVNTVRYFHVDAQGSIVAISSGDTANAGVVVERLSYDAWGKRRNADGTDDSTNNLQAVSTDHGYTGQEHLDEVGLIHMNGRVYDPRLGRFIQADPYIQSPANLQSYNRYTYVMNNPFFYTDPSGYISFGFSCDWCVDRYHEVKDNVANVANQTMNELGANKYVGGFLQMGFLTSQFGQVYGWSTGDWNSVGRAWATSGVMAAAMWAGPAAWGEYIAAPGFMAGGIFITESAAIGYTSSYITARIYGATNDEARHTALLGAKRAAISAGARVGYNTIVGYDVDSSPGGDAVKKFNWDSPPVEGANNIGTANPVVDLKSWCCGEGSWVSRVTNKIPGINAVAGLHDEMQIGLQALGGETTRFIFNVPGMLIAAPVTYAALIPPGMSAALNVKPIDR